MMDCPYPQQDWPVLTSLICWTINLLILKRWFFQFWENLSLIRSRVNYHMSVGRILHWMFMPKPMVVVIWVSTPQRDVLGSINVVVILVGVRILLVLCHLIVMMILGQILMNLTRSWYPNHGMISFPMCKTLWIWKLRKMLLLTVYLTLLSHLLDFLWVKRRSMSSSRGHYY